MVFIEGLVISGISSQCSAGYYDCATDTQYSWITTPWNTYTDLDSSQFVQYHVKVEEIDTGKYL